MQLFEIIISTPISMHNLRAHMQIIRAKNMEKLSDLETVKLEITVRASFALNRRGAEIGTRRNAVDPPYRQ